MNKLVTESIAYQPPGIEDEGLLTAITDAVMPPAVEVPISEAIKNRLEAADKRYFANDNISEFIQEGEVSLLIDELTGKFTEVLKSLVIDIENDPNSMDTGRRLAKMYVNEIMSGRYFPAPSVTAFPNDGSHGTPRYKGMLITRVELKSMCSHHHQPVRGIGYIGIIPSTKVIGLSKYARIAQHAARRGTLQEELAFEISGEIRKACETDDVAVFLKLTHGCCENRGIEAADSSTMTTVLSGQFYNQAVRDEFFNAIKV